MTAHLSPEDRDLVRAVLASHFVMWHEFDRSQRFAGRIGEWRCSCGLKFGLSDTAISHVAAQVVAAFSDPQT